ncbi:MAG: hypothetical protein GWN46_17135 [Gammaproteobacteria bacterium]|nr:hypothetical protein [Gammaproteobacteria bacterium]
MPRIPSLTRLALLAALLTLSACSRVVVIQSAPDEIPPGSVETRADSAWYSIAFRLNRDGEDETAWHLDALLADQVCAPALSGLEPQISLWRFHRRAADDDIGHRFSLRIYTDPVTADIVYRRVREASVVKWLESNDRIASVTMNRLHQPKLAPLARASDSAWPAEIRNSWPWFIMGVSQTWLSLIRQVTADKPLDNPSPDALLDYYRTVNDRVGELWRIHGQHAYLHHLNALFGYELLIIRETNLKRF